jgi:predicted transcriptional regulator
MIYAAKKLRKYKEDHDITYPMMSEYTGVSTAYLCRVVNGKYINPCLNFMRAIEDYTRGYVKLSDWGKNVDD